MLQSVKRHFPNLVEKYEALFRYGYQTPSWYRVDLDKKIKALCQQYNSMTNILLSSPIPNETDRR